MVETRKRKVIRLGEENQTSGQKASRCSQFWPGENGRCVAPTTDLMTNPTGSRASRPPSPLNISRSHSGVDSVLTPIHTSQGHPSGCRDDNKWGGCERTSALADRWGWQMVPSARASQPHPTSSLSDPLTSSIFCFFYFNITLHFGFCTSVCWSEGFMLLTRELSSEVALVKTLI